MCRKYINLADVNIKLSGGEIYFVKEPKESEM
jgi:hypothetical protein